MDKTKRRVISNVKMADLSISEVRFVAQVVVFPKNVLFWENNAFFRGKITRFVSNMRFRRKTSPKIATYTDL